MLSSFEFKQYNQDILEKYEFIRHMQIFELHDTSLLDLVCIPFASKCHLVSYGFQRLASGMKCHIYIWIVITLKDIVIY